MLSWHKHQSGSAVSRWNGVWFRVAPSSLPIGWTLTWGSGDMELGMNTFPHRDDAIEEAHSLALSKEIEEWTSTPVSH
jgi:hypothetical protein